MFLKQRIAIMNVKFRQVLSDNVSFTLKRMLKRFNFPYCSTFVIHFLVILRQQIDQTCAILEIIGNAFSLKSKTLEFIKRRFC